MVTKHQKEAMTTLDMTPLRLSVLRFAHRHALHALQALE